uniref:Secreted protein n=1 Tax=Oryza sativa subsp. japonica TaxID=39947 RepID=Q6ZLK9_ORYSJ|nr:hypothetical protein [Oryza sativa Japonica Group]BAD30611.1 hypothetical protein [Oryza sativa Japonica Group]
MQPMLTTTLDLDILVALVTLAVPLIPPPPPPPPPPPELLGSTTAGIARIHHRRRSPALYSPVFSTTWSRADHECSKKIKPGFTTC